MIYADIIDNTSIEKLAAKVELYNGSTLVKACTCDDALQDFIIDRVGEESKFFGFGVCHKISLNLIDLNRELNITTDITIRVIYEDSVEPYPTFYVSEVNRDESTNTLSITAYDLIHDSVEAYVGELDISAYTVEEFAAACASHIGATGLSIIGVDSAESCFNTYYDITANFDGSETIRAALNAIAEVTQTIYYINGYNELVFKRLGETVDLTISKDDYFYLKTGDNKRLGAICHATELGDNIAASTGLTGSTQYIRDNPFWEMREDTASLVDEALLAVGGLTINQFECEWFGNFLLEIGDKIELITEDDGSVFSYVLLDTITFDGTFGEKTEWKYTDNSAETESNPTSLGEVINRTSAKVDKVNNEIGLIASKTDENDKKVSSLQINTDSISASVTKIETDTATALGALGDDIATLTSKVNATMTSEQVKLEIQTELENGTNKVTTNTGFTFDDEGLTVEKSGSEMKTQITEDGMTVYRGGEAVLTANHDGVDAVNLHATTYLIVGDNSRFENFGSNRTGCFWIGG